MPYIERDASGQIIALRADPGPNATEEKSLTDQEVLSFLDDSLDEDQWKMILSDSDSALIRLIEDLIDLLMKKNIIIFTELPEKAQEKMMERKRIREKISSQNLVVEEIL